MRQLIINKPHLQTQSQKIGTYYITALSWLLCLYFLLPLFTLGSWLMGVNSLSDEIRWLQTLLELLQMYGSYRRYRIVLVLLDTNTSWRKPVIIACTAARLDDQKLCGFSR